MPLHLRNAPTSLLRELGRGACYLYPHDFAKAAVQQDYLPEPLRECVCYEPLPKGDERGRGLKTEMGETCRSIPRRSASKRGS